MSRKDRSDRTLPTDRTDLWTRQSIRRVDRSAFTLFELLLAMAVFAAAAALVMPLVGGLLTDRQLIRAVNQVRAESIRLRTHAMREGRVMKMEIGPGENELTISSVFSAADGLNSADATGAQASLLSGADQTIGAIGTAVGSEAQESWTLELPDQVIVKTIATSPVGGSSAIEAAAITTSDTSSTASGNPGASPAVYFYPTGRTSNAILTISDSKSPDLYVQIRGLTGDVSVRD